jgi:hypothetical protein
MDAPNKERESSAASEYRVSAKQTQPGFTDPFIR